MSMKLGLSSGSYNVRESEASRTSAPHTNKSTIICSVAFLDDTSVAFQINKKDKASILLQKCFDHLDLNEKDYFSLQFCDTNIPGGQVMRWIDPYKSIKKQMKGLALKFFFRVKFYLSDPTSLRDDYTRFQFVRQLRLDILTGRLSLLYHDAVLLSSYVVQSELGDYNSDDHTPGYLSSFKFVAQQTDKFLDDVCSLHSQHRGMTSCASQTAFLALCAVKYMDLGLEMYDAEMLGNHGNNQEIQLGVTSAGLVIFQKNVKTSTFSWQKIIKITFKKKLFYIQLKKEPNEPFDTHSFVLFSYRTCKSLWRSCVEHHTFFRLSAPPLTHRSSLFSISASRFPGKTQLQVMEESKKRPFMERSFKRTSSCNNYTRRTISNPQRQSNNAGDNKHFTNCQNGVPVSSSYPTSLRRCADNFFQQGSTARATLPTDYKPTGEYGSVGRGQTAGGSALTSAVTSPSTTLDRPQRASLRGSARSAGKPHVQGAPAAAPTSTSKHQKT